jgi:hypothetical protein
MKYEAFATAVRRTRTTAVVEVAQKGIFEK